MPDLDLLPAGHALVSAPRPPGGLPDVLTRATRRRRRQQAGALATGAAACAAVLALTMSSGGAVDSLGVTPAHRVDQPAPAAVLPDQASSAQGPGASAVTGAGAPAAAQSDGSAAGSAPGAGAQAQVAATGSGQQRTSPSGGEVGPPHTMVAYNAMGGCGANGPTVVMGWCAYYDGATSGKAGTRVELAEALCRAPGQGAGTLQSDDGQQAEFSTATKDGHLTWTWSKGHRFSKRRTTLRVADGTCVRWHVFWNVTDDAGKPLAPGAYVLDPTPYMGSTDSDYVNANAQFTTFTVL